MSGSYHLSAEEELWVERGAVGSRCQRECCFQVSIGETNFFHPIALKLNISKDQLKTRVLTKGILCALCICGVTVFDSSYVSVASCCHASSISPCQSLQRRTYFSTQIRSGFTKRQSCSIFLALREEYSDVPDQLLEIPLEVVDRLDKEDGDKQGAGPSSSSHPFKKINCAICVEDTRKLIMPLQRKQQQCARCYRTVSNTVGASTIELDTEMRHKLFSYASGMHLYVDVSIPC